MDPALRALRYHRVPGVTVAQACARYGITRAAYERARRAHERSLPWTLEDIVLSALLDGRVHQAEGLVEYVDWLDHARYSPAELEAVLEGAAARGLVTRDGAGWRLCAEWP